MIDEKKMIQNYIDKLESHGMQFEAMKWAHTAEFMYELAEYFKSKVDAPDINVGTKWIPCSERLPKERGNYLVTSKGNTWVAEWYNYTWWGIEKQVRWTDVEAWRELPGPYKKEGVK